MPKKKAAGATSQASQVLTRLQSNMKKLQRDAEHLLGRTRKQATQLAMTLAQRDYPGSRAGLQQLAASCNRCHQTFRVEVEIVPFAQPPPPKVE